MIQKQFDLTYQQKNCMVTVIATNLGLCNKKIIIQTTRKNYNYNIKKERRNRKKINSIQFKNKQE